MFRVLEKNGERRPVYSKSDLEYMAGRGWREVNLNTPGPMPEVASSPVPEPDTARAKRKYTRRAK
jgi:hypothetical protein